MTKYHMDSENDTVEPFSASSNVGASVAIGGDFDKQKTVKYELDIKKVVYSVFKFVAGTIAADIVISKARNKFIKSNEKIK